VPTELSERVADGAPALVERVVLEGAGHNDAVMFGPKVADAVVRLARSVG
jgi:pimeloyl-ACP methyl ester carboxylesterase